MGCFKTLNAQLEKTGGKSILASGFSAVDCHGYCWCRQWDFAGLDLEGPEGVKRWMGTVGRREEVVKIYEDIPKATKAWGPPQYIIIDAL